MASRGVNKVVLVGNLGADPELKYLPSGDAVCSFSVATSESWKDKASGEAKERTEWHRVVAFSRLAEIAGEYLQKGRQVYVEGSLRTEKYTDREGVERYATKIRADVLQFLGGGERGEGGQRSSEPRQAPQQQRQQRAPAQQQAAPAGDFSDDDIPF